MAIREYPCLKIIALWEVALRLPFKYVGFGWYILHFISLLYIKRGDLFTSLFDAAFAVFVKKVGFVHIKGELNFITARYIGSGINARDEFLIIYF